MTVSGRNRPGKKLRVHCPTKEGNHETTQRTATFKNSRYVDAKRGGGDIVAAAVSGRSIYVAVLEISLNLDATYDGR